MDRSFMGILTTSLKRHKYHILDLLDRITGHTMSDVSVGRARRRIQNGGLERLLRRIVDARIGHKESQ